MKVSEGKKEEQRAGCPWRWSIRIKVGLLATVFSWCQLLKKSPRMCARKLERHKNERARRGERFHIPFSSGPKASFRYLVVSVEFCTVQIPRYACSPCGYLTLVYPFKLERRSQFHLHERERTQLSSSKVGKSCGFLLEDDNRNLFDTRK